MHRDICHLRLLCVLPVYCCTRTALQYLVDTDLSDVASRQRLCSASRRQLAETRHKLSTLGPVGPSR